MGGQLSRTARMKRDREQQQQQQQQEWRRRRRASTEASSSSSSPPSPGSNTSECGGGGFPECFSTCSTVAAISAATVAPPHGSTSPQHPFQSSSFLSSPPLPCSSFSSSSSTASSSTTTTTTTLRWKRGDLIGKGAFGRVYLALSEKDGTLMAVKTVPMKQLMVASAAESASTPSSQNHSLAPSPSIGSFTSMSSSSSSSCTSNGSARSSQTQSPIAALERELSAMRILRHPNIVCYKGTQRIDDQFHIFMQYVPGGSLESMIKRFGALSTSVTSWYTAQILEGLSYLHSNGIVHMDIKGANVLVDADGICKLSDFGACRRLKDVADRSLRGTPYWLAPELLKGLPATFAVDIWSMACTVIEMLTGQPPWVKYKSIVTILYYIANATDPLELPKDLAPEAQEFLLYCLKIDPDERPCTLQAMQHPFVSQSVNEYRETPSGLEATGNCRTQRSSDSTETILPTYHHHSCYSQGDSSSIATATNTTTTTTHAATQCGRKKLPQEKNFKDTYSLLATTRTTSSFILRKLLSLGHVHSSSSATMPSHSKILAQ